MEQTKVYMDANGIQIEKPNHEEEFRIQMIEQMKELNSTLKDIEAQLDMIRRK